MMKGYINDIQVKWSKESIGNTIVHPKPSLSTKSKSVLFQHEISLNQDNIHDEKIIKEIDSMKRKFIKHVQFIKSQIHKDSIEFTNHVNKVIQENNSYRQSGIGSHGGHIARILSSPGPHNGHTKVKESDSYFNIYENTAIKPSDIKRKSLRYNKTIENRPNWQNDFVLAHSMDPLPSPHKEEADIIFKRDIRLFTASEVERSRSTNAFGKSNVRRVYSSDQVNRASIRPLPNISDDSKPTKTTLEVKGSQSSKTDRNIDTLNSSQYDLQFPLHEHKVSGKVKWTGFLFELHTMADSIPQQSLLELSWLRHPPGSIAAISGYLAILLGLDPDWVACKRSLFREIHGLCNFLCEVSVNDHSCSF